MQSSVTSRRASSGLKAIRVKSSAEASARAGMRATSASTGGRNGTRVSLRAAGLKFIHGPEIKIPRHQDFDPIPLILGDGRWNVDGVFEHVVHDVLRARWVENDRTAVTLRGHGALHSAA